MKRNSIKVILIVIIILIGSIISVIFISKNSMNNFIKQNDDSIIIDFSNVDKITVSYLSENKQLTDAEKTQLISNLQMLNYPIIYEQQLIVSTDLNLIMNICIRVMLKSTNDLRMKLTLPSNT